MEYENCEWCVYRDKRNPDTCMNCSHNVGSVNPKFELGKVDIFKLAEGLKKKHQEEQNQKKPELNLKEHTTIRSVNFGECPFCGKLSLFYNESNKKHECANLECKSKKV
ncbi:hypothetical protein [Dehalococcoides mccartyi]|uniref:hypothetical protein n=1 Tax=Dehalococcoides mccartyi TaxID=61435 RepID=UPI001CE5B489|nr:hypothetical protein [Dehalococcoides mccartyi]QYY58448.1 hypothetical protein CWV2_000353 [Dehalococcoides mccartyi]